MFRQSDLVVVAKNPSISRLLVYLLGRVLRSYLRGYLRSSSPGKICRIKHNSQLLGNASFFGQQHEEALRTRTSRAVPWAAGVKTRPQTSVKNALWERSRAGGRGAWRDKDGGAPEATSATSLSTRARPQVASQTEAPG